MKALANFISQHVPFVHLVGLLKFPFIPDNADRTVANTFGTNRHTHFGRIKEYVARPKLPGKF